MDKNILQAALFSLLFLLTQLVAVAPAQAAPGDFLFVWGSQQHFRYPGGVAADANGNVYVTDTGKIHVFNSSGMRIAKWGSYGSGYGQVSHPNGIAVDGTGTAYVADTGNDRIVAFDSNGRYLRSWTHPRWVSNAPIAVASDGRGKVYVAEAGTDGLVLAFDSQGTFLNFIGTEQHPCSFSGGVAVDADGNLYVANRDTEKVEVFSFDGKFLRTAGEWYLGYGIAVDQSRNVYAIDAAPPGFSYGVIKIDSAGKVSRLGDFAPCFRCGILEREEYWTAYAVAVDGMGNLFRLDSDGAGLSAMGSAGISGEWWAWGACPGQMSFPQGIATDSSGNVYTTDGHREETAMLNDRVQIFSGDGKSLGTWGTGATQTSGLILDDRGHVHVLQTTNPDTMLAPGYRYPRSVGRILDQSGQFHGLLGPVPECRSDGNPCIDPYGVAIDKSGNALVTERILSRVSVYDSAGAFVRNIDSPHGFYRPAGIAVDRIGNIYLLDAGNSRVQVFDSSYTFLRKWGSAGSGDGEFSTPMGIAVDGDGHVFVADTCNNRVQVFDSAGTFLHKWGGGGDDNGLFSHPEGIAVNSYGTRVYVADTSNNRVQAFEGYVASFSIAGTVRQGSASGPAVAGVTLAIAGRTATTTSTGSFSISGVPAGTHTLTVSGTGYVTNTITGFEIKSNSSGLEFYLTPEYSVSGTVHDGSIAGAVLPGATVSLAGKTSITSSTGTFSITVPAGIYILTISKTGYVTKTIPAYEIKSDSSGLDFYLAAEKYSLSGTVRLGGTTGPALAGATVAIAGKSAITSSTGAFGITGIPAGTYTLTVSKSGYPTKSVTGCVVNSSKSGLVFFLQAYTISGTVRQWSTTGPVLPGATVAIAGKRATTSSTGAFTITGIPPGTFTLTVSKPGYATKTVPGCVIYRNISGAVFYLSPTYTLSGTVRQGSETGPVLAGAKVVVAGKSAITGSTGTFSISGIPAGTYTLTISRTGYVTKTVTGLVVNSNKSGVIFYLAR